MDLMREVKFTKGPWVAEMEHVTARETNSPTSDITYSHSVAICYGDNARNNARLIAAAPDLYDALSKTICITCELVIGDAPDPNFHCHVCEPARDALKKARGGRWRSKSISSSLKMSNE